MSAEWGDREAEALQALARVAGAVALKYRSTGFQTENKGDGTPVTLADREAQDVILKGLASLTPSIPVVAEEKENPESLIAGGTYWLVDPLDGTREFVAGRDEFTVNIGLIENGCPTIGVLYAPAMDDLFYADARGAWRVKGGVSVALRPPSLGPEHRLRLITSRREVDRLPLKQWLESGQIAGWRICSSAYKFGLLAAGEGDIFVRTARTSEWDTAAGEAILRAVGGQVVTPDGKPLAYGKPGFVNSLMIASTRDAKSTIFAQEIGQRLMAGFF